MEPEREKPKLPRPCKAVCCFVFVLLTCLLCIAPYALFVAAVFPVQLLQHDVETAGLELRWPKLSIYLFYVGPVGVFVFATALVDMKLRISIFRVPILVNYLADACGMLGGVFACLAGIGGKTVHTVICPDTETQRHL